MVLRGKPRGRVGRRRGINLQPGLSSPGFFFWPREGLERRVVVATPSADLQSDQTADEDRREELSDERLRDGETARGRKHRRDVAVSDGGQGHEAEVDQ